MLYSQSTRTFELSTRINASELNQFFSGSMDELMSAARAPGHSYSSLFTVYPFNLPDSK
jgi:hypothetical protein